MSDDNAQGTPPSQPPGWNAPPAGSTPPPPPPDATGAIPTPPKAGAGVSLSVDNPTGLVLGIVAVAGVVLGLLLSADLPGGGSISFWDQMGWTWAILGIVAAATTLVVPLVAKSVGLGRAQVTGIVTTAAGVLGLWWVLFILPSINSNRAFLATAGTLAAAGVAWLSRGTDDEA